MNYQISQLANRDIESIWIYTLENWSVEQADRYLNLILDEVEFLAANPESGQDYGKVIDDYFRSRIKSHFIFYKINKEKNEIHIIRVLHQRMDIDSLLNG